MKKEEYQLKQFDEALKFAKKFDDATLNKNVAQLKNLIDEVEYDIERRDIYFRVAMYYSLASATFDLWKMEHIDEIPDRESLQKQLFFYRKSIELFSADCLRTIADNPYIISLKTSVYVNYGNTLDACGRKLLAIEQYYNALRIYPFHPMALGNLGSSYLHYSMFLSSNKRYVRDCINYYAVQMLEEAIYSDDYNIHDDAKAFFISRLATLSPEYIEFLRKDIQFHTVKKMTKSEQIYRQWGLEGGLFLSPLSDLPCNNLSFAIDEMSLPPIVISGNQGIPIIIGMFNQLKQEYISARYLYYESLNYKSKPHFSDKMTSIAETLEYAQFSLRVEKLKCVYKTLFGILDKIAYFLNEYFDLGIQNRDINFKSIWQSKKLGKNGYEYKNTLDTSNNFALASLYWIQRELEKSDDKYASPEFTRMKEVRNSLEHRYTIVTMFTKQVSEIKKNDVAMYISESELYELTLNLLQIVREAIICIVLCVNVEEAKKIEKLNGKIVAEPFIVHEIDDEFKF